MHRTSSSLFHSIRFGCLFVNVLSIYTLFDSIFFAFAVGDFFMHFPFNSWRFFSSFVKENFSNSFRKHFKCELSLSIRFYMEREQTNTFGRRMRMNSARFAT